MSPEEVENNLHARFVQCGAETPQQILSRLAERDGLVSTQSGQSHHRFFIAAGNDDFRCAQIFRYLDSLLTGDAGSSIDQHHFAGLELRPAEEGTPSRKPRISECGGNGVI